MKKSILARVVLFVLALVMMTSLVACAAGTYVPTEPTEATQPTEPEISRLNGVPLSQYSIVYCAKDHDYSIRAAQYVQAEISARTGLELPLVEDCAEQASDYEIVVGETTRAISSRLTPPTKSTQFAILAEDTQIAIEGEYFVVAAAAYFFVETYVPEDNFSAEVPKEVSIHTPIVEKPENFIMLIGDGMGVNQTLLMNAIENNVEYGDGENTFYGYYLPYLGYSRTNSLSGTTDSAAGGTALSAGYKTKNGYVGQDKDHKAIPTLIEQAGYFGMSTAVMSTEVQTGATPASFSTHADSRNDTSIILGGQKLLTKTYGTIINCDFDHYDAGGVASIRKNFNSTLNKLSKNENGFFLMYEEAHIDKHCHNNNLTMTFNAVVRFNQVIAACMEYAFYHPNTFVLITADHETGGLTAKEGTFVYTSKNHTSADVPVFAYGVGAELFNDITVENIQIPQTIASFMGKDDFGDQSTYQSLTK